MDNSQWVILRKRRRYRCEEVRCCLRDLLVELPRTLVYTGLVLGRETWYRRDLNKCLLSPSPVVLPLLCAQDSSRHWSPNLEAPLCFSHFLELRELWPYCQDLLTQALILAEGNREGNIEYLGFPYTLPFVCKVLAGGLWMGAAGEVHSSNSTGTQVERGTSSSSANRVGLLWGRLLGPASVRLVVETVWCTGEDIVNGHSTYPFCALVSLSQVPKPNNETPLRVSQLLKTNHGSSLMV